MPLPPHNAEAERAVIGAIILDSERAFASISGLVGPDDFFVKSHEIIYRAAAELHARGLRVEVVLLDAELRADSTLGRVGGTEVIADLAGSACTVETAPYHARLIADCARRREIIRLCGEVAQRAGAEQGAEDQLEALESEVVRRRQEHPRADRVELVRLSDRPPSPTKWLIRNVIPEETALVLGAEEKTGKSWLAFLFAICVVTGRKFLEGYEPANRGPVLIYSPESGWNARSQRLWSLCRGINEDPARVLEQIPFISQRLDLASLTSLRLLRATVKELRPMLLIFDPLIACFLDRDENASGEMQPVLNSIRDLIELSPGMSVIVAHHLNKGNRDGTKSPFHGLRGTSALGAWSDGLIGVRKITDTWDAVRRLDVVHRDAQSPPPSWFRVETSGDLGLPDAWAKLKPCRDPAAEERDRKMARIAAARTTTVDD